MKAHGILLGRVGMMAGIVLAFSACDRKEWESTQVRPGTEELFKHDPAIHADHDEGHGEAHGKKDAQGEHKADSHGQPHSHGGTDGHDVEKAVTH